MTLAGKKLQDIYNSGVKALTELETQAIKEFEEAKAEHAHSLKESAEKSSQSIQEKFDLLQVDLKQSIDNSLKKLENVLASEDDQNQAFTLSLSSEIRARSEQMKLKLSALRQSQQENVDFASSAAGEEYLSHVETIKMSLEQDAAQVMQNLATQGRATSDRLLENLAQTLWQARESAKDESDSFLLISKKQVDDIASHSSALAQSLAGNCQNKLKVLETAARQVNQQVETSARSLLETVAKHANNLETQINEKYSQLTDSYFKQADASLSDHADQLSALHDVSTAQLVKNADQLSAELLGGSEQAQAKLRNRCDQSVTSVNAGLTHFKGRLEERLQFSRGQKQALEDDKNKIVTAIQNELLFIQDSFEKKISALLIESKTALTMMTESVQAKIITSVGSCDEQINTSAMSIQKQIEDDVTKFLNELSVSRQAAIEEISAASKGYSPLMNLSQKKEPDSPFQPLQLSDAAENIITERDIFDLATTRAPESSIDRLGESIEEVDPNKPEEPIIEDSKTRRNRRRRNEE